MKEEFHKLKQELIQLYANVNELNRLNDKALSKLHLTTKLLIRINDFYPQIFSEVVTEEELRKLKE